MGDRYRHAYIMDLLHRGGLGPWATHELLKEHRETYGEPCALCTEVKFEMLQKVYCREAAPPVHELARKDGYTT
jgi:hypothetical protein